jgi:hypothetical protein
VCEVTLPQRLHRREVAPFTSAIHCVIEP